MSSSVWVSRGFFPSSDVQLDLKIHVGSLLLRSLPSAVAEAYVSLQLFDGGLPLHSSPRCTGVGVPGAGGTITWDEWVTLPVRIRDLTLAAVIVARVWTAAGCVAGSTVRVFDARSALKRGRQSVTVWRRGADVDAALRAADAAAAVGGGAGDESAALALVAHADSMAPLRALISRIASRDVPECPWTDRLLWAQVQVELLADVRRSARARARARAHKYISLSRAHTQTRKHARDSPATPSLSPLQSQERDSVVRSGAVPATLALANSLILGDATFVFPTLDYPVIFSAPTTAPQPSGARAGGSAGGSGSSAAAAAQPQPFASSAAGGATAATPAWSRDLQAALFTAHTTDRSIPPVVLLPTTAGAAALAAAAAGDEANATDALGRAFWSEQLCIIADAEADAGDDGDNPSDAKYHKLARGGVSEADVVLKPTRVELARLQAAVSNQELSAYKPTAELRDLFWRFRYSLLSNKRALTRFAAAIDWTDEDEAREVRVT